MLGADSIIPFKDMSATQSSTYIWSAGYDCSILPPSINNGWTPGCPGAVYTDGSGARSYCQNNDKFPWWEACCVWDSAAASCLAKPAYDLCTLESCVPLNASLPLVETPNPGDMDTWTTRATWTNTCAHTNKPDSTPEWWKVTLSGSWNVSSVTLTNRADTAPERLQQVDIYVGGTKCAGNVSVDAGATKTIPCIGTGTEIKVQHREIEYLQLCGFSARGNQGGTWQPPPPAFRPALAASSTATYTSEGRVDIYV